MYPQCAVPFFCQASTTSYINLGSIRNQGWELQGTTKVGPLAAKGTYSWNESRIIGITPKYRNQFPQFTQGGAFAFVPEHTWALEMSYACAATNVSLNLNGIGQVGGNPPVNSSWFLSTLSRYHDLNGPRASQLPAQAKWVSPRYVMADLNATRQLTTHIDALFQVQNLTNFYQNDVIWVATELGRQTKLGFRIRM